MGRVGALLEVRSGIHPDLSGRQNVYLYGNILGMSPAEIAARFDDIVDFAEIGDAIDRQVKFYSTGMAIRLGFAIAAFLEPDILLVDEVLAVGDARFQQKCLERISQVVANGTTLVLRVARPPHRGGRVRAGHVAGRQLRARRRPGPRRGGAVPPVGGGAGGADHRPRTPACGCSRPRSPGPTAGRSCRARRSTSASWPSPRSPCSGPFTSASPRARPCPCSWCATPARSPQGQFELRCKLQSLPLPKGRYSLWGAMRAPRTPAGRRIAPVATAGVVRGLRPRRHQGARRASWCCPRCTCPPTGSCPDPGHARRPRRGDRRRRDPPPAPSGRRHRALALDVEGFAPDRVVVVVNGEGGLDDPELERAVRMVRLPSNIGPAGGFRRGMLEAFADPDPLGLSVRGRHGAAAPPRAPRGGPCWPGSRRRGPTAPRRRRRGRLRPGLRGPLGAHRATSCPAGPRPVSWRRST